MACYPRQPALEGLNERGYDVRAAEQDQGFEADPQLPLKSHSTRAIVRWLEDTYHYEDCICLPRSTIYEHYSDFCSRNQLQPVNAASFGKIIRQQFPTLTTRRLGTRGQSKYHYYGLGIKPTSIYYTEEYVQKQNHGVPKKEPEAKKTHAYYAAKDKPSAVLPKFPDVKKLNLSDSLPKDKLHTFMVMYRAHCQRILDSVVRANFDEVENFLLHFWQGMPAHLVPVLGAELVVDLVAVCDTALYKAVVSIYIATPLQNIPDNVAQEVRRFTNNLKFWLEPALAGLPECLIAVKMKAADMLCKNFKRQRSLMHLADAARNAFKGEECIEQLESDWGGLNLQTILAQTLYAIQPLSIPQRYLDMVPNFLAEFSCMFADEKCSLEDFALWIETVMDNCLKDVKKISIKTAGKAFLLTWKFFTSKIVREFTLMSAPSFGTFHLLHMLVDDYIMHTLETMLEKEHEEMHLKRINLLRDETDDAAEEIKVEDRLASSNSSTATQNLTPHPVVPTSMPEYTLLVPQGGSEFKHTMAAQEHASGPTSDTAETVLGGRGSTVISEVGVVSSMENKRRKGDFSSRILPQAFPNAQDSGGNIMSGIAMEMEPGIQGLGHNSAESSSTSGETFQGMLGSQDSSNLQTEQGLRFPTSESESSFIGRSLSLSHPNLSSRPLLTSTATTAPVPTHSQAPIPFPNISGFALSSMMGFTPHHPHLQSQSLSMNPSVPGGLMQGLGLSVGSNQTQPSSIPSSLPQTLSLPNSAMSGLLGSMQNPSISIMNAPGSLGAGTGGSRPNLPQSTAIPMPLTHPNLQNPAGLPLIPGMPNMYSYPYAATIPAQPPTTTVAHAAAAGSGAPPAGFPSQPLVPSYSQYLPPSIYRNPAQQQQQPPVSTANFSR